LAQFGLGIDLGCHGLAWVIVSVSAKDTLLTSFFFLLVVGLGWLGSTGVTALRTHAVATRLAPSSYAPNTDSSRSDFFQLSLYSENFEFFDFFVYV